MKLYDKRSMLNRLIIETEQTAHLYELAGKDDKAKLYYSATIELMKERMNVRLKIFKRRNPEYR